MEFIAVTINGIEEIVQLELKELINASSKILVPGRVKFETSKENIKKLIYITRSISRVYSLESSFKFIDLENILKNLPSIEIKESFRVKCLRKGNHPFCSKDVEKKVGEYYYKKGNKVDLENSQTVIYVEIIDQFCIIGIDLTKKKLHKREYHIKIHNQSPNALIAYSMIRFAKWKDKEILLDPFAKEGIIPIEAALFGSNIPRGYLSDERIEEIDKKIIKKPLNIFGYDPKLNNVRSCEINSKIAEVNKQIKLSKIDIDWLDVKFEKESVDKIISTLPFISKDRDSKEIEKQYKQFFNQAEFILKKTGKMVLLIQRLDLVKKYHTNFNIEIEKDVTIGDMHYKLIIYKK